MMTEDVFDAYVAQIIQAAKSEDAEERVGNLLAEFKEKMYLEGRHMLIDTLRHTMDGHDDRIGFRSR